jgi:cytochrome c-type biogenesis protein CcmH
MTRRIAPAALTLALAAIGVAAVVTLGARDRTVGEQADALARELRCPDCQGLSVADSPTQSAAEIRRQIDEMLTSGASAEDVRDHFVARYGEWILLAPSSPVAWALPLVAVVVGAAALMLWLFRARTSAEASPRRVEPSAARRVRDEVEALDA